jgi:pilus assembly protein FimV
MKPSIKKASLVAAAIASFPLGAQAAGLGRINVLSGLGQPLQAEIQVNATPQELQSLGAKVASPDAFVLANVPYAAFVPSVSVTVENRGNRPVLKLTSSRPVNEPMVGLLLEVTWQDGRLLRTYNFLLDPVDLPIRRPEPIARVAPPVVSTPDAAPLEPLDSSADTAAASESAQPESTPAAAEQSSYTPSGPATRAGEGAGEGEYTVQRGDTLAKIASTQLSADSVDLDQALVALYRANPSAFHSGNLNRLRTGAILKLPSNAEIQAVDRTEARREVRVQASNFNAYRLKVAENTGFSAPEGEARASGGRIGQVVEPKASTGGDKIELTATGGGNAGTQARLRALEDELAARNASLKEANERIKELEGIVSLLQVQSKGPVEQPVQPTTTPQPTPPDAGLVTPPPLPPVQDPVPPVSVTPPPIVGTDAPSTVEPPPTVVDANPPPVEPEPPKVATPTRKLPPPLPPPPEPDLLDTLTDPLVLGAGGGLVALLGGFFGFRAWQRKRADALLSTGMSSQGSDFPTMGGGGSIFGDNGGQSVDTGSSSSVIHTDFSQTGTGFNIDTSEGVDPVAEADVYMAYGRDTQAEEILNDALKADPQRGAIYVKLLEIYAQRHNIKQFETTASELYARTQGQGRDWEKAAQLGRKLDPSNPLYGGDGGDGGDSGGSGLTAEGKDASEPEPLHLGAPHHEPATLSVPSGKGGHSLSGLDFGASLPGGASGQLKNTVAVQENLDQLLGATRVVAEGDEVPVFDLSAGLKDDTFTPPEPESDSSFTTTTGIDFDLDGGDVGKDSLLESPTTGIDFDLGGNERVKATAAVSTPAPAPAPVAPRPQPAAPAPTPSVAATKNVAENDLASSLEFDLPEASQIGTGSTPAFDMNATVVMPMVGAGGGADSEATLDLERTSFDPSALDFDLDLSATGAPSSAAPHQAPAAPAASAAPVELADSNETDTKLELARAYQDMGDTEGALDLLREIVAESSGEQKTAAQALIDELS